MSHPKPPFRVGLCFDVHRLKAGRKCILGGVEIPSALGPDGHSDADVLTHALADAILGSVGLRDIGHHFPNTDKSIEGIDSQIILAKSVAELDKHGYRLVNVDAALISETPKIGPHIAAMKARLSQTLGIPEDCVGIKATTNEKLDDIGASLGISAHAVALVTLK